MSFSGVFVDDENPDLYAELLSCDGLVINGRAVSEAPQLASEIFNAGLDIVILDFRLDENPELVDPRNAYLGSGLAQFLRDKAISEPMRDVPVVLMSAEAKFEQFYRPDSTAHDLFDRTYQKEVLTTEAATIRRQLISLSAGYKSIKEHWLGNRLELLLPADVDIDGVTSNQEIRHALAHAAAPHICANYILRNIIDRPGLLLADHDVAARLGIATVDSIREVLISSSAQYLGIFADGWPRWWAHKINEFIDQTLSKRPAVMGGDERAYELSKKFGIEVQPAVSSWNGRSDERFMIACASCRRPTEIRHSVSAFDPFSPRFAQRKRICWDCVQLDRLLDARLEVDDIDAGIAKDVLTKSRDEG